MKTPNPKIRIKTAREVLNQWQVQWKKRSGKEVYTDVKPNSKVMVGHLSPLRTHRLNSDSV